MLILYPFLANILSDEEKFYKKIDEIYYKNEDKYLSALALDKLSHIDITTNGSIVQNTYYKKIVGILLSNEQTSNKQLADMLLDLFPFVQSYFNKHSGDKFILEDFSRYALKKLNHRRITDNCFIGILSFGLSCAISSGLAIEQDNLLQVYCNSTRRLFEITKSIRNYVSNEERKILKPIINLINKDKQMRIKESCSIVIPPPCNSDDDIYAISQPSDDDITRFIEPFNLILNSYNLDLDRIFQNRLFSERELTTILKQYYVYNINRCDEKHYQDIKKWLVPAAIIAYLCKAYKEADEYINKNSNRIMLKKLDEVRDENNILESKSNNLLSNNIKLSADNDRLKKENARLKKELEEYKNSKTELVSLRNFAFNLHKEDFHSTTADIIRQLILDLNSISDEIVIIGGHPNWVNKLKEVLKCKFINAAATNFDVNILNDKKIILNTDYLSHSIYYKVIAHLNSIDNIYFISGTTNIDLSIRNIHDCLFKQRES